MKFHLLQDGHRAGEFSLDALRHRREAGELTGRELVWRAGMTQWQPLEVILQIPALPPSHATSRRQKNFRLAALLTTVALVVLAGFAAAGYFFFKKIRTYSADIRIATQQLHADAAPLDAGRTHALTPVVTNASTLVEKQFIPRHREFRLRQWVENYRAHGDHAAYADAAATQLIQAWVDTHYPAPRAAAAPPLAPLVEKAVSISATEDPLVLTVAAAAVTETHPEDERKYLERACVNFEKSKYPAYPKFFAIGRLAQLTTDKARRKELDLQAIQLLGQAFTDGSLTAADQDEIGEIIFARWGWPIFQRHYAEMVAALQAAGTNAQWLALAAEGQHEIVLAWRARGGGYADTVTDNKWQGFRGHTARARECFTAAWELNPHFSITASRMIYVVMGDGDYDEMRLWFNRATAVQLDNFNAWDNLRFGIRPRWHGNLEAMLDLGISAVDTGRFDTRVPYQLMTSVRNLADELGISPPHRIYARPDIWPHIQRCYEGYIAEENPGDFDTASWRSGYISTAFVAGKYDIARRELIASEWQVRLTNLQRWHQDVSLLPLETAARTSPLKDKIAAAETAAADHQLAAAQKIYSKIKTDRDADDRTRQFIRARLATLELETKLATGDWIDFQPRTDDDPLWHTDLGSYTVLPNGDVEVKTAPEGHLLICRANLGIDFEMRGEVELVHSPSGDVFHAGVAYGEVEYFGSLWNSFRLQRTHTDGAQATVAQLWRGEAITHPAKLNATVNTFQLRSESDYANGTVNGALAIQLAKFKTPSQFSTNYFRLALGADGDGSETVLRYRHIQVRQLHPAKLAR